MTPFDGATAQSALADAGGGASAEAMNQESREPRAESREPRAVPVQVPARRTARSGTHRIRTARLTSWAAQTAPGRSAIPAA